MCETPRDYGNRVHQAFHQMDRALGFTANNAIGNGSRLQPDRVDFGNRVVREYKPLTGNVERAIKQGLRYVEELQRQFGGEWSLEVQPYVEPLTGAKFHLGAHGFGWTGL